MQECSDLSSSEGPVTDGKKIAAAEKLGGIGTLYVHDLAQVSGLSFFICRRED